MAQGTAVESSVAEELPEFVSRPVRAPADVEEPADEIPDNGTDPTEARAREMGWKPLDQYRGPPGKWQPAREFIERGENILPIVRQQNRVLTERVGRMEGEISSLRSTADEQLKIIKDLREMGQRADQRGYDRAMSEIKAKQRQAVAAGDTQAYDQLVEQAEALSDSRRPAASATTAEFTKPAEPARPPVSTAVQAFVGENKWFNVDPFLTRKMIDRHIDVIQEGEILDEAAQLAEAKRRMVEDYPERFGVSSPHQVAPRRPARRAAAVTPPTPEPPASPNARQATINAITDPQERAQARDAFNRMKRQMPDFTEAEYMALYDDPHGDILDMQQQKPRKEANGR